MLRGTAAIALGGMRAASAAPRLRAMANDQDQQAMVRSSAIRALGYLADVESAPLLARMLRGETDELVALELVGALERLLPDHTADDALAAAADNETKPASVIAAATYARRRDPYRDDSAPTTPSRG
jgi:HEAT repeat protein